MSDSSLYSKSDAERILRRASEIEGSPDPQNLSLAELRSIAQEAGFGAAAVERAIAEAKEATSLEVVQAPVQTWGLIITHLSTLREIPVELTADQLMRTVRLFHPYREGPAHVKLEERELTWRDQKGLRFALSSSAGRTEVRVYASKVLRRRGRWTEWVKSAADRLETLVTLVARGG